MRLAAPAGVDDVSVILKHSRLFAVIGFEKNSSQQEVVPNTDAYFDACLLKVGNLSLPV